MGLRLLVLVGLLAAGFTWAQSNTSCQGRCGAALDPSKPCQCNDACITYEDCCDDYPQACGFSCVGRCGPGHDTTKPCQCNTNCVTYGDCCYDYQPVCVGGGGTCEALTTVTEYFWANDVNRLSSSQYTVNWQTLVADGNTVDRSPERLFTYVNSAAFNSRPTFTAFVSLLDNFNTFIGSSDHISTAEWTEINNFYNLVRSTSVFNKLVQYLTCKGLVTSEADFKTKFYTLWFNLYPRSSSELSVLDSNGFEHVFAGEMRVSGTTVSISGFHSWIQFYQQEQIGAMDYYGYVRRVTPYINGANFNWIPPQSSRSAVKALGSFFLGTSPEFDLAMYTVCALEFTNSVCNVRIGGTNLQIQTWDINHVSGSQIGSAYPRI